MTRTPSEDLLKELKDPEYARRYGDEMAKVDFGITMTNARKNLDLTQRGLAEKLGIKQPYIARLERGEANPTLGAIGRLLAAISLRLVTGTAPLQPHSIRPSQGIVWVGAGDAIDPALHLRTPAAGAFPVWQIWEPIPMGTLAGTASPGSVRTETREGLLVGGAAR